MKNKIAKKQAEKHVKELLQYIGENAEREGLIETPKRYINALEYYCKGYKEDPKKILSRTFDGCSTDEMVVVKDVEFYSLCEHHLAIFYGKAHMAYLPNARVVGISKLVRLLDCYSRRLQIQERLTNQIANAIMEYLKPKGCGVIIEAAHFCMRSRGVEKQNSLMVTSALRGTFKDDAARNEFLSFVKGDRR